MNEGLQFSPHSVGVDEVGRGPVAGPLVVCACILLEPLDGLNDSKKLSGKKRLQLSLLIVKKSILKLSVVSPADIDKNGIFPSVLSAMGRATSQLLLTNNIENVFIDGTHIPDELKGVAKAVIKGDQKDQCIAGASIVAKVVRDHIMEEYARLYTGYGFERHKGYGTSAHYKALKELGPCPIHRRSFRLC